jgi:outer membrane lipoprotein-sorting protein
MGLKTGVTFALLLMVQTGCISTKRVVPAAERPLPAQTANRSELLRSLEEKGKQIQTLQGTVTLDASGGAMKTGVLTEYRQTKGYILVERPGHIRIKAQAPLALATVFDMVSDGNQYRVYIPIKNKFIIGDAHAPGSDKNPVLNLRPQHLMNALFVDVAPYVNNSQMKSTLEETTQGRRSFYVFSFIDVASPDAQLIEKVWIDRTNMQIARKQIFGKDGKTETDVEYSGYQTQDGDAFPQIIVMERPIDDYMLKITFQRTTLNEKLAADAFNLERPQGSELVQLEAEGGSGSNLAR